MLSSLIALTSIHGWILAVCAAEPLPVQSPPKPPPLEVASLPRVHPPMKPEAGDRLGHSLSLGSNTLLVGLPGPAAGALRGGKAHLYTLSGTTWTWPKILTGGDTRSNDAFGESVAMGDDVFVIGAPAHDALASNLAENQGAAYVYRYYDSTWNAAMKLGGGQPGDAVGYRVAASGSYLAVSAPGRDHSGKTNAGAVNVHWIRKSDVYNVGTLQAGDPQTDARFGDALAMDGETVIVGAPELKVGGVSKGAAYVFFRSGTTWTQQAKLQRLEGPAGSQFGRSVAIAGDCALVGAPHALPGAPSGTGVACLYVRTGTTWTLERTIVAPEGAASPGFGSAVALDPIGQRFVVGSHAFTSYTAERIDGASAGAVYAFARSPVTSVPKKLVAAGGGGGDDFGWSLDMSLEQIAIGAPWCSDSNLALSGAIYVR